MSDNTGIYSIDQKKVEDKDLALQQELEELVLMVNAEKVGELDELSRKEIAELKERQSQVRYLHDLVKVVNDQTDSKGVFNCESNDEIKHLIDQARDFGVQISADKYKFSKDEKDRLLENIHLTVEDLNTENEMQLQGISRMTNERYEAWQLARATMKVLDEAKRSQARAIRGG